MPFFNISQFRRGPSLDLIRQQHAERQELESDIARRSLQKQQQASMNRYRQQRLQQDWQQFLMRQKRIWSGQQQELQQRGELAQREREKEQRRAERIEKMARIYAERKDVELPEDVAYPQSRSEWIMYRRIIDAAAEEKEGELTEERTEQLKRSISATLKRLPGKYYTNYLAQQLQQVQTPQQALQVMGQVQKKKQTYQQEQQTQEQFEAKRKSLLQQISQLPPTANTKILKTRTQDAATLDDLQDVEDEVMRINRASSQKPAWYSPSATSGAPPSGGTQPTQPARAGSQKGARAPQTGYGVTGKDSTLVNNWGDLTIQDIPDNFIKRKFPDLDAEYYDKAKRQLVAVQDMENTLSAGVNTVKASLQAGDVM